MGKTEKSLLGERKRGEGCSGEKQKMTYFGEIRAWRDKRYLRKTGWDDGARLGRTRKKKTLKREKGNTERQSSDSR